MLMKLKRFIDFIAFWGFVLDKIFAFIVSQLSSVLEEEKIHSVDACEKVSLSV